MKTLRLRTSTAIATILVAAGSGLAGSGLAHAQAPFTDATQELGLQGLGGGVAAWGDYDNDGWCDLYTSGQLWRNCEGQRFERISNVPLAGAGIWGDADNDGDLDLFSWNGKGAVYRNDGHGGFKPIEIPPLPMAVSLGACWGDFDGDGRLDLYVGGYEAPAYQGDVRYRNLGEGKFQLVWKTTGSPQPARGITAADFDEDGDLDIYVSNYRIAANMLWQNDGKGAFSDVAAATGVAGDGDLGAWGHTIGSCWGDLDNDGHLDLFAGNFSHPPAYQDRPKFLQNLGPAGQFRFEDRSATAGLHWQESYASPTLGDFDNDGLLDLYFTTVYPGDHSVLYRNQGDWKFTHSKSSNVAPPLTYQAAWCDFDDDGDLDLVTGGKLLRNPGNDHHWLKVRLAAGDHRSSIGAQVRLQLGPALLTRQVEAGTGQGNQNDPTLHFGLGDIDQPVTLEIRWPSGRRQVVPGIAVDQNVEIDEP